MHNSEPPTHSPAVATLVLRLPLGPSRIARQSREFNGFSQLDTADLWTGHVLLSPEHSATRVPQRHRDSHKLSSTRDFASRPPTSSTLVQRTSDEVHSSRDSPTSSTRSANKEQTQDSTALRYHVCRVSALCSVRNFRSHSNQTMGCATHMNVHVSLTVDVTKSVQTESKRCVSMACGWCAAQTGTQKKEKKIQKMKNERMKIKLRKVFFQKKKTQNPDRKSRTPPTSRLTCCRFPHKRYRCTWTLR